MRTFTSFFVYGFSLYGKSLFYMWKGQVIIEFCCGPYLTNFYPTVLSKTMLNIIWFLSMMEVKLDILKESLLIGFYCKMIMRFAFADKVVSDITLGQQSVSSNFFSFNINRFQKGDDRFNFIGLFNFISPCYGYSADFFWV